MSRKRQDWPGIESEMLKCELIEGLQRAIDRKSRWLLETARSDWERNFAGKDPSDACVSVQIHSADAAAATRAVPASGFLKARKPSRAKDNSKRSVPRFAQ